MNIKKPYALIVLFSFSFFIISELTSFYIDYQNTKIEIYKNNKTTIDNLINAQQENIRIFANMLSVDRAVVKAYEENNPEIIKEHIGPMWKRMRKEKLIYEIHFFKPPAISFVNFSNFDSLGQDVSRVRKDILWVTSSFRPSTHNLMCKTYAGVRATYPIFDGNGTLLGGLSLGKKIDWLPQTIKNLTKRDAFLVYTKEAANSLAPKYYQSFIKDKKIVDKYILANPTFSLDPNIIKNIDFSKEIQTISINSEEYLLNKYPILDFTNSKIGYIFVLSDTHTFYSQYLENLLKNFILVLLTAIVIFFVTKQALEEINKKLYKSINDLNVAQTTAKMGSYFYHMQSNTIEWSDNHYRLFHLSKNNFIPTIERFMEFVHPEDKEIVTNGIEHAVNTKKDISFEYRIILKDNTLLYVRSTALVVEYDEFQRPKVLSGTIQDITQYKKLEIENQRKAQKLIEQLYTDELTNLPNRRALIKDMQEYQEATLAIVNIKSFKNINDVFGFDVGNFILQELANRMLDQCTLHLLKLYRIGSDEFAILNDNVLNDNDFEDFIANIIVQIENETFAYSKKEIEVNISIYAGICFGKENRLACADVALNEANEQHKDYVIYSSTGNLLKTQENKIKIINIIKNALLDDDILVYFQPILNRKKEIHKYEALVRLRYDDEILSPFHFLEISKKTKYYPHITRSVIRKSFDTFKLREESFSINLIAEDILNETTLSFIRSQVQKFEDKERIVFEIVESEDIYQIKEVADFIKEMQQLGIKIAIDDFGTGYSNFSYMMELQPDYIKIDGSLIKELDTNHNARNIVTTIITFAKELKVKTVAEFVHSKEIFEICKELGVDEFQGYYFSEPKATL